MNSDSDRSSQLVARVALARSARIKNRPRKREPERRPVSDLACDANAAAVRLDETFADIEAKTETASLAISRSLEIAVEEFWELLCRNARPRIHDLEADVLGVPTRSDDNRISVQT